MIQDHYTILGVDRLATATEIKRAYRRLARKYHPDVSRATNTEEIFKRINQAYRTLRDPAKRADYDRQCWAVPPPRPTRPPPATNRSPDQPGIGWDESDDYLYPETDFPARRGFRNVVWYAFPFALYLTYLALFMPLAALVEWMPKPSTNPAPETKPDISRVVDFISASSATVSTHVVPPSKSGWALGRGRDE